MSIKLIIAGVLLTLVAACTVTPYEGPSAAYSGSGYSSAYYARPYYTGYNNAYYGGYGGYREVR
jgi:hypothetical protein